MYTNDTNNGNGKGHKRIRLSLSDLKNIATLDPDLKSNGNGHIKESETNAKTSAKDETHHVTQTAPQTAPASSVEPPVEANSDESDENLELIEREEKRKKWKRVLFSFGIISSALVLLVVVGYLRLFAGSDETYRVENQKGRERASGGTNANASPQGLTVEEIRREMNHRNANAANDSAGQQTSSNLNANTNGSAVLSGNPVTDRLPLPDYSATVAPSPQTSAQQQPSSVMNSPATARTLQPNEDAADTSTGRRSALNVSTGTANSERSIRVSALSADRSTQTSPTNLLRNESTVANQTSGQAVLPPLGTMLPVRTLGTIYTLRAEGYVRMQLVRAASGRGWSLPRGTELYGVVRGSDFEIGRAYVQLVGFIDQNTGRLVRLQGSLMGSDGTEGLRGQKRNLQSGWTRALRIAGAGFVEALGTVAATVGRRPVYAGDIYGYSAPRVTSPLMQEINGIAYRQGRAGFVEVRAGTPGYVLVMTSPREIQGVEVDLSSENLQRTSDATNARDATRMSESELAELMTNGDAETIRRALPRMTPEMRRVALAALAGQ
ncbi:MAG: hypothetical protein ACR2G4_00805 [Pyrinomonadaceae bacterium]